MGVEGLIPAWQLSEGELSAALVASEAGLAREYARNLELVAEADKRGLAGSNGFRDTAALLERGMRVSRREARARVAAATAEFPVLRAALAAGDISFEHVREIEQVLSKAPASVTPEQLSASESTLVELARQAPPANVRKAGRRLLAHWDLEDRPPADRDRDLARPRREFRYTFTREGRMRFTGEFDPETAALAEALLVPLAKPDAAVQGLPDQRTTAERHGDAVAAVFDLAARAPDLPVKAAERAVVTVTVGLEELERRAGTVFLNGYGAVTVDQLRKMCCDARVVPAVLGSQGEVLDLGRAVRTATPAQRRALALRDKGCTAPGCTRGPKWCVPHHTVHWADGGPTNLAGLGFTCERDHHLLHHGGWTMRLHHGAIEWIPPTWYDPKRRPIRNTAHDPPP
ncbi:HNH endonuclease signature motif containing protein [Amycolatopsis suaedae]|uniref:HNH endonuclease n=1 Tax=Amycolatopsis suaedae TaxID=2510978 RepID=A0A4Q7J1F0_9PSEU|nr:HNH endonuclease signature motif containing protein [Amycolatopsis suaedae]RZQ60213.1 HNH endonuclease [Amycolatopsis suaedae]